VASIFFTALLGVPEGLIPVQLLWVNLVTDGLPATALAFNPPEPNVMAKPPRQAQDALISGWVFIRYMVIGVYVGVATVGIFIYWFVYDVGAPDGHSTVTLTQLRDWGSCPTWQDFDPLPYPGLSPSNPCSYFTTGKVKAMTLSLTVLVVIEMFNALNALGEDVSLTVLSPWANLYLVAAILGSFFVHFVVLYVPLFAKTFTVCPLDWHDWLLVLRFSVPVILIDEFLKLVGRKRASRVMSRSKDQ
jgi:Ca2+-transporting ATPase